MTVLLVAHGTRSVSGVEVAHRLADELGLRTGGRPVRLAFVDVIEPGIREVLADAPGPVTVVPAFLAQGHHVRVDVPREVLASGRTDVTVAPALGPHPELVAAARDRLAEAGWLGGDAVVLAAAGSKDPRARRDVLIAARRLSALVGRRVATAFVATGSPRVADVVERMRDAGESRIVLAPWLLAPGVFHTSLRACGADAVAEPLGAHRRLVDLLALRAAVHPSHALSA